MNRYLAIACLGLGLMVSPLLNIGQSAVPPNPRIAIIDIENTLSTTPAGKRANEQFEKIRKGKQAELDKKQTELKKQGQDLEKQRAVLKDDVFKQKREELQKKVLELNETYMKLEKELATDRTKLIQELLKKAEPIIKDLAKKEGVHLIIDQSATIWADPTVDLTQQLNAQMK
jgi:outer membrane protein